jgi:hypothetical protein
MFNLHALLCKCGSPRTLRLLGKFRPGLALLSLSAVTLSGSTITYSDSGTFLSGTAQSAFSGSNEAWSFSFMVDSQPAVFNVNAGNYFDVAFSDFNYSLNGVPAAMTPVDIRFYSAAQYGGFSICLITGCFALNNPTDGLLFLNSGDGSQSQMYTGPESAPTMLAETWKSNYFFVFVNSNQYFEHAQQTVQAVATAEPSVTIPMLGFGLFLGLASRRKAIARK